MSKKLVVLALSLLVCLAWTACGKTDEKPSSVDSQSSVEASTDSSSDAEAPAETEEEQIVVTFKQDGVADIVRRIEKGETLTDIPTPMSKTGYTVVWDRTDFTNLTENVTVTAMEKAKTYTVTLNANGGNLSQTTLTVTYKEAYALPTPTHEEYVFDGWTYQGKKISSQGIWELDTNNLLLSAEWNEGFWSDNY